MFVVRPHRRQQDIGEQAITGENDQKRERQPSRSAASFRRRLIDLNVSHSAILRGYRLVSRQPAASASSTEQNQRVPLLTFIWIFAYHRLEGW